MCSLECESMLLVSKTRQICSTMTVALCSLAVGMSLEWTWCSDDVKTDNFDINYRNKHGSQVLENILFVGMIIGAGPAAFISSNIGLKTTLVMGMMNTILGSYSILYSDYSGIIPYLWIGRIMHGIGAGFIFVIVPNYAVEIANPKIRGVLINLHYIYLLMGMFLSHVAREFFVYSFVNTCTIPVAVLCLIALLYVQEPPYYRLKFEKLTDECNYFILNDNGNVKLNPKTKICNSVYKRVKNSKRHINLDLIFQHKVHWQPLLINVSLILIQQLSGVILWTNLLQCVYNMLGISEISPMVAILFTQLIVSILRSLLMGYRNSLIVSGFGTAVCLTFINYTYSTDMINNDVKWLFIMLCMYTVFHAIGYGSIPWILMAEMSPKESRLWTSAVTVSLYALLNQIIQSFSENIRIFYYGEEICFMINAIVCVLGAVIAYCYVPSKKNNIKYKSSLP